MDLVFLKICNIPILFPKKRNKNYKIFLLKGKFESNISFLKKNKIWQYNSRLYFYLGKLLNRNFLESFYLNNIFYLNKLKMNSNLNWAWEISLGIFFILFGFFSATSAITIIGSVADWDPLAAAVMLCWTELFTKIFYFDEIKSFNFKLINSFKIGINFGMFVDALKLTS